MVLYISMQYVEPRSTVVITQKIVSAGEPLCTDVIISETRTHQENNENTNILKHNSILALKYLITSTMASLHKENQNGFSCKMK